MVRSEPSPFYGENRDSGKVSANRSWLRRFVKPRLSHLTSPQCHETRRHHQQARQTPRIPYLQSKDCCLSEKSPMQSRETDDRAPLPNLQRTTDGLAAKSKCCPQPP